MKLSEADTLIAGSGMFDMSVAGSDAASIRSWINTSVQEAVGAARWLKQVRNFGPTVVGQADYAVDADVIDVRLLRVNGSLPWSRGQLEDAWTYDAFPIAALTGNQPGLYVPTWEAEEAQDVTDVPHLVKLTPTPSVAGYKIEAQCSVMHPQIDDLSEGTLVLGVPNDLVRRIAVDGAIALGITLVHARADLAASYTARFETAKTELAKRTNTLIGSGPSYARVWRGGRSR